MHNISRFILSCLLIYCSVDYRVGAQTAQAWARFGFRCTGTITRPNPPNCGLDSLYCSSSSTSSTSFASSACLTSKTYVNTSYTTCGPYDTSQTSLPFLTSNGVTDVQVYCTDRRNSRGTYVEDLMCYVPGSTPTVTATYQFFSGCDNMLASDGSTLAATVKATAFPTGPTYYYNLAVLSSTVGGTTGNSALYIQGDGNGRFQIGPSILGVDNTQVIQVTAYSVASRTFSSPLNFTFHLHTCTLGVTNNQPVPTAFSICRSDGGATHNVNPGTPTSGIYNSAGSSPIIFSVTNVPPPIVSTAANSYIWQGGVALAECQGALPEANTNVPMKVISSSPTLDLNPYISMGSDGHLYPNFGFAEFPAAGLSQTYRACVVDNQINTPFTNGSMTFTVTYLEC